MLLKAILPAVGLLLASVEAQDAVSQPANAACRCIPGQACWPSLKQWDDFDVRLGGGRLIKTSPIAKSCYPGPDQDAKKCAYVTKMWPDQDFMTTNPIGRALPWNITCAPVDYASGDRPTTCLQGQSPTYAVNATSREHVRAALAFAQRHNIRVTVASTGHDMLGRSDGYGSLEIWLRYFRNSIKFQDKFQSAAKCSAQDSKWSGNAIRIDGAYQWRDVHPIAKANNVVCVSGGSVSPGAIGGWPSGGGHGPASRTYGLGADQILEAEVMLVDGRIVTANHCQNQDLLKALRGGGPGYGVVLGQTIKVHPNVDVVGVHHLTMTPKRPGNAADDAAWLDALTVFFRALPDLNTAGYAGYGYWFRNSAKVVAANSKTGYAHGFWTLGKSKKQAEAIFAPTRKQLTQFEKNVNINSTFVSYPDYWTFYDTESGQYDPAGDTWVMTSRMIDPPALKDRQKVRDALAAITGSINEATSNVILLASGGQVFKDANDELSGLNPAWRTSPFVLASFANPAANQTHADRAAMAHDMTFRKGAALKKLAPGTGGYMNEGDRSDPDYIQTFYGAAYKDHLKAKRRYDPGGVLYCPTCVGAEAWLDNTDGALCRR